MPTRNQLSLRWLPSNWSRHRALFALVVLTWSVAALWHKPSAAPWKLALPRMVEQVVDANFGIGYAVTAADINRDGKTDIVAINPTQVVWFENPTWKKHVVMDGLTKKDNVCVAVHDIDGDRRLDVALGAEWMPTNTESGGSLQWLRQPEDSTQRWELFPIAAEPTLHRIRWGDVDGDGKKELIVAPLQGRGTKPPKWETGNGVRLLAFSVPKDPATDKWKAEVIDESFHALHNLMTTNFDADSADEIITASLEGVFLLDRESDGVWKRTQLGEGNDDWDFPPGAGEIKLGRFKSGRRYLATVEPWHGHQIVVYVQPSETAALWTRRVLDDKVKQGHALGCADFDGDGDDELVAGWRETGEDVRPGIAMYDPQDQEWASGRKSWVDEGGMAAEDLVIADLNQDGRPDLVASGRATHNIKIYWHPGK